MEQDEKPRRLRRWLTRVTLCLGTAVIVSSAYMIYMFQWTTYRVDLETANRELARENHDLENAFRRYVRVADEIAETTGFEDVEEEVEVIHLASVEKKMKGEMEAINRMLSSPLPASRLNFRNLVRALIREKQEALEAIRVSETEAKALKKQHEYELKDVNLQALIYLHKIDRLEKQIVDLKGGD